MGVSNNIYANSIPLAILVLRLTINLSISAIISRLFILIFGQETVPGGAGHRLLQVYAPPAPHKGRG